MAKNRTLPAPREEWMLKKKNRWTATRRTRSRKSSYKCMKTLATTIKMQKAVMLESASSALLVAASLLRKHSVNMLKYAKRSSFRSARSLT
jgi:hypothetical protein